MVASGGPRRRIVDADDARDRIGVLRLAAAERILQIDDIGVRVAKLGREIVDHVE